ncbi:MAG TPA: 50S ribosomal protein L15 [Beutenbergiaceae bacterium]|nr:50S ribosomal protein L15 [Beutenbergiaceae bacterium]
MSEENSGSERQLKLHHLRPATGAKKSKIRVGRGDAGKGGTTAGRGTKGTKARGQVPARFEGGQTPIHMRLPKRRGLGNPRRSVVYQVINLDKLSKNFEAGAQVGAEELVAKGLVRGGQPVKVLGTGEISVALNVTADSFSASAKEKIEAAGGSVTVA